MCGMKASVSIPVEGEGGVVITLTEDTGAVENCVLAVGSTDTGGVGTTGGNVSLLEAGGVEITGEAVVESIGT